MALGYKSPKEQLIEDIVAERCSREEIEQRIAEIGGVLICDGCGSRFEPSYDYFSRRFILGNGRFSCPGCIGIVGWFD
jgi:hypothetical protein